MHHIQREASLYCNLSIEIPSCALHKYTKKHPITCLLAQQLWSEQICCVAFWSQCGAYKLHAAQHQHSCPLGFHKAWSSEAIGGKLQAELNTHFLSMARQEKEIKSFVCKQNIGTPKAGMWIAINKSNIVASLSEKSWLRFYVHIQGGSHGTKVSESV